MEWIDVRKRAPAQYQRVILAGLYTVTVGYRENGDDSGEPCFVDDTEWIGDEGCHSFFHVTHWMPLPEPPPKDSA